jgi:DNA-binding response OmpR family regulator
MTARLQEGPRTQLRLAVVEDDPEFRDGVLMPVLAHAGFDAFGMGSALELYRAMVAEQFDLVLLDVGLPDEDGLSIASHLRGMSPSMGIVMLTAHASGGDRVQGLQAGADAYLCKPVNMKEVVATLLNLARRIAAPNEQPAAQASWRLDASAWRIFSPRGVEVAMSSAERKVITKLAESIGVPVTREELIACLTSDVHNFDPHRLDLLIYRLRKKCLKLAREDLPLKAVRGIGYVLSW